MIKLFKKFKKHFCLAHLGPIFHIFGAIFFFSKNRLLSRTTLHGTLKPCKVSEKTNEQIPENARAEGRTEGRIDGRTDGWMEGHTDLIL